MFTLFLLIRGDTFRKTLLQIRKVCSIVAADIRVMAMTATASRELRLKILMLLVSLIQLSSLYLHARVTFPMVCLNLCPWKNPLVKSLKNLKRSVYQWAESSFIAKGMEIVVIFIVSLSVDWVKDSPTLQMHLVNYPSTA